MNQKVQRILLSIILVLLIILFISFNLIDLILGPLKAPEAAVSNTVELYERNSGQKVSMVYNRFSLDNVYTFVEVDDKIVVLLADGQVVDSMDQVEMPEHLVSKDASYGYFENEIIYVVTESDSETFYDIETGEIVFSFEMED